MVTEARRKYNREQYLKNRDKVRAASRRWRLRNRDRVAAYLKKYRADHAEQLRKWREEHQDYIREYSREYYIQHREAILKKSRQWSNANRDHVRERNRNYTRSWRKAHPDHARLWREEHPDYESQYRRTHRKQRRTTAHRYRARFLDAPGSFDANDIKALLKKQKGLCFYCKEPMAGKHTIDHSIPLTRDGTSNNPSNIVLACRSCNSGKCDKTLEEFQEYLRAKSESAFVGTQ